MISISTARSIMIDLGYDHNDRPSKADIRARIDENRAAGNRYWKYMESSAVELLKYLEKHNVPRIGFVAG